MERQGVLRRWFDRAYIAQRWGSLDACAPSSSKRYADCTNAVGAFPSLYESQFYTLWLGLINKRVSVRQLTGKRRLTPIISGYVRQERLSLQPRLTHLNQTG